MLLPFRAAGRLWRSRTDYGRALGVHAESPRGTLLIQAIAGAAWPETATVSVDWVDDFVGSEPRERRQLRDPASWNAKLKPELAAAAETVRARGFTDVRIDGAFRLSTGFAAGAALPRAAGLTVTFRDWSSSSPPEEVPIVVMSTTSAKGTNSRSASMSPTTSRKTYSTTSGTQISPSRRSSRSCQPAALANTRSGRRARQSDSPRPLSRKSVRPRVGRGNSTSLRAARTGSRSSSAIGGTACPTPNSTTMRTAPTATSPPSNLSSGTQPDA